MAVLLCTVCIVILRQGAATPFYINIQIDEVESIEIFYAGRIAQITDRAFITAITKNFDSLLLQPNAKHTMGFAYRISFILRDVEVPVKYTIKTAKTVLHYDVIKGAIDMDLLRKAFDSGELIG